MSPTGAVVVGHLSSPVPAKLVWKIWRWEYIYLNLLLPHCLSAPELTLADALQYKTKELKEIEYTEHWVVCFNTYISVVALRHPHRIRDLLAYSLIITKAADDFKGTPWLSYESHFCSLAATIHLQTWGLVDQSLWSQNFSRATLCQTNRCTLSIGPYSGRDLN